MVTTRRVASAACAGLTLGALLIGFATAASAKSTSDQPASILVYPKIVVSGTGSDFGTDTVLDISNINSTGFIAAHCWMINANSHCASDADNAGRPCEDSSDCPNTAGSYNAACVPGWSEIDFEVKVTHDQPLAWSARHGLRGCFKRNQDDCEGLAGGQFPINQPGYCKNNKNLACNPAVPSSASICPGGICVAADSNYGSAIPPVPEIPFVGAIKCIQYSTTQDVPDQTSTANALIGHAAITTHGYAMEYPGEEVERYNAIGLKHLSAQPYNGTVRMDGVQYAKCPSTLVLNHFYDGAPVLDGANTIRGGGTLTDLTLIPCGDDYLRQIPGAAVAQFITINEFEQRLSAAKKVDCLYESIISSIDTGRPERSIFSYNVQGSFAGQTLIKGAGSSPTGHGLLGVARVSAGRYYRGSTDNIVAGDLSHLDFSAYGANAAYNLQQKGSNGGVDLIVQP